MLHEQNKDNINNINGTIPENNMRVDALQNSGFNSESLTDDKFASHIEKDVRNGKLLERMNSNIDIIKGEKDNTFVKPFADGSSNEFDLFNTYGNIKDFDKDVPANDFSNNRLLKK